MRTKLFLIISFYCSVSIGQTTINLSPNEYLTLSTGAVSTSYEGSIDLYYEMIGDYDIKWQVGEGVLVWFFRANDYNYGDLNSLSIVGIAGCTRIDQSPMECFEAMEMGIMADMYYLVIEDGAGGWFKLKVIDAFGSPLSITFEELPTAYVVTNGSDSGTGSLREAISSASSGESIFINSDVELISLSSDLNITKSLVIKSLGFTTIKGDNTFRLIDDNATQNDLTFENLRFINGKDGSYGGGIGGQNVNLVLTNCIVEDNEVSGSYGGGIATRGTSSSLTLNNTIVRNNKSGVYGGGIGIMDGAQVTMIDSEISNNSAGYGGGIQLFGSSSLNATNTVFHGNKNNDGVTTSYSGKAILAWDTTNVTLTNVSVTGHDTGGAVVEVRAGTLTVKNSLFNNEKTNLLINSSTTLTSLGHNFSNDTSMSGLFNNDSDVVGGTLTGANLIYLGGNSTSNNFGNIQVGATNDNKIDTSSGDLTIDSASGITRVDDNLVVTEDVTLSSDKKVFFGASSFIEGATSGTKLILNANDDILFRPGNITKVTFDPTGNVTIAGDLNINSDARLKANIISLGGTLSKLLQIDGKSYTMKKDVNEKQKIGLIAQDIEKVFPELVSESSGVKSVNYQGLVPVLINALKEQDEKIKIQQLQIDELKNLVQEIIK